MPATGILGAEHRSRERRAFRLLALHPPVYPTNGSMPQNTPLALSLPGPVARNGLSLACNGCRFHGLHSRVNGPDLLLRSLAHRCLRPFGPDLHPRRPVCPGSGVAGVSSIHEHVARRCQSACATRPYRIGGIR